MGQTTLAEVPSVVGAAPDFDAFFEQTHPLLLRVTFLVLGERSDAEDAAQDAMVKVLERWDRIRVMENPTGYAVRVAIHVARRRQRRIRRLVRGIVSDVSQEQTAMASVELRHDFGRALRTIPRNQREALVLVDWMGLNSTEAGRALGVRPSAVRVRVMRARAALRAQMGQEVRDG